MRARERRQPSADVDVSVRLLEAGRLVGVELLDHVVVAGGRWCSLREQGLLPPRLLPETPFAAGHGAHVLRSG